MAVSYILKQCQSGEFGVAPLLPRERSELTRHRRYWWNKHYFHVRFVMAAIMGG